MTAWHRTERPALLQPVETERFHITPLGALETWKADRAINADTELLQMMAGTTHVPRLTRPFATLFRPNDRSRFVFGIRAKAQEGEEETFVGIHSMILRPYRTAHLGVILSNRDWWGFGVVLEVRRALIAHFTNHAGVSQFTGTVRTRNVASMSNYIRLGFEQTGIRYQNGFDAMRGEPMDWFDFSLRGEALDRFVAGLRDETS